MPFSFRLENLRLSKIPCVTDDRARVRTPVSWPGWVFPLFHPLSELPPGQTKPISQEACLFLCQVLKQFPSPTLWDPINKWHKVASFQRLLKPPLKTRLKVAQHIVWGIPFNKANIWHAGSLGSSLLHPPEAKCSQPPNSMSQGTGRDHKLAFYAVSVDLSSFGKGEKSFLLVFSGDFLRPWT